MSVRNLDFLCRPRSLAVIGASDRPGIGTRRVCPVSAGPSAVQIRSSSSSPEIARLAPVRADLKRSRGDSWDMVRFGTLARGLRQAQPERGWGR